MASVYRQARGAAARIALRSRPFRPREAIMSTQERDLSVTMLAALATAVVVAFVALFRGLDRFQIFYS
jgi:hypothetical protein